MNAEAPDNKRQASRQRTLKGGWIVFGGGSFKYECTIKNLSATGALLAVSSSVGIPNNFDLVFGDQSPTRVCNVAWRSADKIGVAFVGDQISQ